MTYGPRHGDGARLNIFSDPQGDCVGSLRVEKLFGIRRSGVSGADAVTPGNAVRFRIAAFPEPYTDADGDGFDWAVTWRVSIGNQVASRVLASSFCPGRADAQRLPCRFHAPESFDRIAQVAIA